MDEPKRPPLPDELQQLLGIDARPPQPSTKPQLTPGQRRLVRAVSGFVGIIAAIGFAGSYTAVTKLARAKGFGWFAWAFPAGIDAGIGGFLALDLLLTWLRMPYPLLRQMAWALTAATICFNASAAWGDWLAVGMHGVIPILFVVALEAARHATGRVADITANRFIESPPLIRWIIAPRSTLLIWRRMRLWHLRSYEDVITRQRELATFRTRLRARHGRWNRDSLSEADHLVLGLARFGTSVSEALAIPEAEAEAEREAEVRRTEAARLRAEAEAEQQRQAEARQAAEAEAKRVAEAETAARLAAVEARRRVVEAEAAAALAAVQEQRRLETARAEAELRRIAFEEAEAAAALKRRTEEAKAAAVRKPRPAARTETPNPKPKSPPNPNQNPKPKPAELTGRRAQVEAEVQAVLNLIRTDGYDAVGLDRVKADFGLKHSAAYDRLDKARTRYRTGGAVPPQTGTDG